MTAKVKQIEADGVTISIINYNSDDYMSLTDMIKAKDGDFFISDWLRNANTLDYIAAWESMNNQLIVASLNLIKLVFLEFSFEEVGRNC